MDDNLCNLLITKGELKQSIFAVTLETMQLFKDAAKSFEEYYRDTYADDHDNIPVLFTNKNQYQFMLKFGGDVLIFLMHTNVFEFSRDHEVMRTPYIKEDRDRSYCGMIQIFNFLGDSLKYDRVNDLGYMITEPLSGTIPAQTPVLLKSNAAGDKILTLQTVGNADTTGNILVGADYFINEF
ncbi:MAG: hypothetical protein II671_07655, partial [Salinivirgaceae bacterium]|nr:hypothetical protein [Salinivirgaceae bacterium]